MFPLLFSLKIAITALFFFLELSHAECVLLLCVLMYIIHSGNKIVKL